MTDERAPPSLRQAVAIVDDQLGIDPTPVLPPPDPFLRNILHRKVLERTVELQSRWQPSSTTEL